MAGYPVLNYNIILGQLTAKNTFERYLKYYSKTVLSIENFIFHTILPQFTHRSQT